MGALALILSLQTVAGAANQPARSGFDPARRADWQKLASAITAAKPVGVRSAQSNVEGNVHYRPGLSYAPTREQLPALLKQLAENAPPEVKFNAKGSGHAWSPSAATSGVQILPDNLGGDIRQVALDSDEDSLRASVGANERSNLVRVGSGTTVATLNARLWDMGKSLAYMGGYDGQRVGGVMPTGTHGSVLLHGTMSEMIRSIDLTKADGTRVRIEPSRGALTDPVKFHQSRANAGRTLIQDDDVFAAAKINVGTFGVVESYVLKATDKFYLNEMRTPTTFAEARKALEGGRIYQVMQSDHPLEGSGPTLAGPTARPYHIELLWNPTTDKMTVTSRSVVQGEELRKLEAHEPRVMSKGPYAVGWLAPRDYRRPILSEAIPKYAPWFPAKAMQVASRFAPNLVPKLADLSQNQLDDPKTIKRSYEIFNLGNAHKIPAQSATISVPLRGDMYLRAMDVMKKTAAEFAASHTTYKYETSPISIRFVKASTAMLGDPEDTAKFELIFGGDSPKIQQLSKDLVLAHQKALEKELGASNVRFHWGQLVPEELVDAGPARVEASYPRFQRFMSVRDRFDPDHRFMGPWLEKMWEGRPASP